MRDLIQVSLKAADFVGLDEEYERMPRATIIRLGLKELRDKRMWKLRGNQAAPHTQEEAAETSGK